ncbi:hypothetical protein F4814DRAFT_108215 [Daldinia grandis]|nr:hypothetical protein F4814DRAFT_108215 [Daldinia grandis]
MNPITMYHNTHHANQPSHPQLQVIVTATTSPGDLYRLKQGGLFLAVAEDTTNNSATTGGCCNCVGNRKRKSLVASLTELLSRPWAVRECRVVGNDLDMLMAPWVQVNPRQSVCYYHGGGLQPFTTSQGYNGEIGRERERELVELEGDYTYEHNRR